MASPKSDDDVSGGQPKLSETDLPARPGVYVQVSGTPRKKKSSSSYKALESGNHAVEETRPARASTQQAPRVNPGPLGMGSAGEPRAVPEPRVMTEPRSEPAPRSQSEVREKTPIRQEPVIVQPRARAPRIVEINESSYEPGVESENTNYRADMVRVSSRPPSMAPERLSAASVLDAKPAVRSEPPAPARTPWVMIAMVSVMSAIITAAGVVAIQEWMREKDNAAQAPSTPPADSPAQAVTAAPTQPAVVAAPVAVPAPSQPVAAEAVPTAPSVEAAPTALAAQPTPVQPTQPAAVAPQMEPTAPVAAAAEPVSASPSAVAPAPVAPAPVAEAEAPVAAPAKTPVAARAPAPIKRAPVATEPAKPSLAFRKPPESWGTDEPAAPAPTVDTAAIPSNPYAGDAPVAP